MKIYKFLPYDKNLVSRARELRKSLTEAEKQFWFKILRSSKLKKLKFTRQKPIGSFVLDFYCAKFKLGIEIDGEVHEFQKIRDEERDNILRKKFGLTILRFQNTEVLKNPEEILEKLVKFLPPDKGDLGG